MGERSDAIASKSDFHKIRKFCEDCHEEEDSESDSSLSSLWMILFLLLALVAGVVSYDVYAVNKGVWKDSRTHQYLEEAGALQLVDHAYSKINQLVVPAPSGTRRACRSTWRKPTKSSNRTRKRSPKDSTT